MFQNKLIHFRPLGSDDAELIHRLQKRLFPPEFREPVDEIREILKNTEQHLVCNFSFGIFDDTKMVGYLFAWVDTESLVYKRAEDVVYLKEIGLLPGHENLLRPLFERLYRQWQAYSPGIPLEAHAIPEALENWNRLIRVFRFYGLHPDPAAEGSDPSGSPYRLLRLNVDPATVGLAERARPIPRRGWEFGDSLSVTVVSDANQWLSIRGDWDRLLGETHDGSVFQSFDYLWQWWKYRGIWNDLRIFVIRRGDKIIGVVPMMLQYYPVFGRTMRNLMFLTARMDMSRPKLIFGQNGDDCLSAFLAWLASHPGEWDILDIEEQLPDQLSERLATEARASGHLVAESETVCPFITLEGTWDEFLASRTSRMRSNVRRIRRRLAEEGPVRVDHATKVPDIERAMEVYCDIEKRSWKSEAELDLESDRARYYFNHALATVFGASGVFEIRTLVSGEKPIASTFGIAYGGVFQSLKIAHDEDYQRFSPGTLLESYEIESLFDSDLSRYEFLGSFVTNKLRWTDEVYQTVNFHIFRRRPRLVVFYAIYFVLRTRVKDFLKRTGYFDRVFRLMNRFRIDPFPRYD